VETLHTMCQWAYLYNRTVTEFGNAIGLNSSPWYFDSLIPLQALVGAAVQVIQPSSVAYLFVSYVTCRYSSPTGYNA
jgi:hypothetical protein